MPTLTVRTAAFITFALGATACTPAVTTHGFQAVQSKPEQIEIGVATRDSVREDFGSPSTSSVFEGEEVWYYLSGVRTEAAYRKPKWSNRQVTEVTFDEDGVVDFVDTYDLDDARRFAFSGDKTPTRGRELSLVEQLFGSIGLPTQTLPNQQNLPGGAGGPRPGG